MNILDLILDLILSLGATRRTVEQPGPGARRAFYRLAEKRERNKAIPDGSYYTRQQARAESRRIMKDLRSMRKTHAMQTKAPGGAAEVR